MFFCCLKCRSPKANQKRKLRRTPCLQDECLLLHAALQTGTRWAEGQTALPSWWPWWEKKMKSLIKCEQIKNNFVLNGYEELWDRYCRLNRISEQHEMRLRVYPLTFKLSYLYYRRWETLRRLSLVRVLQKIVFYTVFSVVIAGRWTRKTF